jgi:hypothetical protein
LPRQLPCVAVSVPTNAAAAVTSGGGSAATVTVTLAVVVWPAALAAVRTYGVVDAGVTARLPLAATAPRPWSIETVVALAVVQVSVADCPAVIAVGAADNEAVGPTGMPDPDVRITMKTPKSGPVCPGGTCALPTGIATTLAVIGTLAVEPS